MSSDIERKDLRWKKSVGRFVKRFEATERGRQERDGDMKTGRRLDDYRKTTRNGMGTEDGLACWGAVQDRPPGSKASKAAS